MSRRRPTPVVLIAATVLAAALAFGLPAPPPALSADQAEVIRGTVEKWRPGILVLTDVRLPNGMDAGKPVMVIVNKDTAYFDGPLRTTRESVTKGVKVLVRCEPAGTGRLGVLVRIVGGKSE